MSPLSHIAISTVHRCFPASEEDEVMCPGFEWIQSADAIGGISSFLCFIIYLFPKFHEKPLSLLS